MKLAIWSSGPGMAHCIGGCGGGREGEGGGGGEGVAPLLKSRDPHLADGE